MYNDLNVSVLKVDTNFNDLKKKALASLYVNIFVIKHNNPDQAGGRPRSAYVENYRNTQTPFFKFIWQTLLTGIKPCAGVDKKTQNAVVALQNQQAINKQSRKIKKEQRIEKRAERRKKRAEKKLSGM